MCWQRACGAQGQRGSMRRAAWPWRAATRGVAHPGFFWGWLRACVCRHNLSSARASCCSYPVNFRLGTTDFQVFQQASAAPPTPRTPACWACCLRSPPPAGTLHTRHSAARRRQPPRGMHVSACPPCATCCRHARLPAALCAVCRCSSFTTCGTCTRCLQTSPRSMCLMRVRLPCFLNLGGRMLCLSGSPRV